MSTLPDAVNTPPGASPPPPSRLSSQQDLPDAMLDARCHSDSAVSSIRPDPFCPSSSSSPPVLSASLDTAVNIVTTSLLHECAPLPVVESNLSTSAEAKREEDTNKLTQHSNETVPRSSPVIERAGSGKTEEGFAVTQLRRNTRSESPCTPFDEENGSLPTTLLSATPAFWFNGQVMRVETVAHSDEDETGAAEREETRVRVTTPMHCAWARLDCFRLPCRFSDVEGESSSSGGCPSRFLNCYCSGVDGAVPRRQSDKDASVPSIARHEGEALQWRLTIEGVVAAHICADAQRRLFRWRNSASEADADEGRLTETPLRQVVGNGEERDALLQWWSVHH